jgi:hypothetical protein
MNLERKDYDFGNPSICQIIPKHIELQRVLINLYMLLKYDGRRPVPRAGRKEVTLSFITEQLINQNSDRLPGFRDHQDIIEDWIHSDLLDLVYRGIPEKEKVASPLPLHLNAYKLRNPNQANDYRGAEHIFSMIQTADPNLTSRLKVYLGQGMNQAGGYDIYDGETRLDLDTLAIVRMVDNPLLRDNPSSTEGSLEKALCIGQSRLLCDDLHRILAYEDRVPRSVMISYLRTAIGLHLGLYLLRLFKLVTGWVQDQSANPACLNCPVQANHAQPFANCPYAFQNDNAGPAASVAEILVDMGEDHTTHMAGLAMDNCGLTYETTNEYIRSVFLINQLFRYTKDYGFQREHPVPPKAVADVLKLLKTPPGGMEAFFNGRINSVLPGGIEGERAEVHSIYAMKDLPSWQTFIELVSLERTYNNRRELTRQLDAVFMKNQDTCLLRQGKGKSNRRRWYLGSGLLEFLVQIAVLKPAGQGAVTKFISQPILIDDFVTWLRERYGLVIMPNWPHARIEDNKAFNANLQNLKRRLREIGFYTDLSDAYNTQTIRPRYSIGEQE